MVCYRHGHTRNRNRTKTYNAWVSMRQRCYNPAVESYPYYGGRGITVCARWRRSFAAFLADMGEGPPGMSLDRINVNGNYTPTNCRWASNVDQRRNRRFNRTITIDGLTLNLTDWSKRSGVSAVAIRLRLARDWDARRAVFQPAKSRRYGNGIDRRT